MTHLDFLKKSRESFESQNKALISASHWVTSHWHRKIWIKKKVINSDWIKRARNLSQSDLQNTPKMVLWKGLSSSQSNLRESKKEKKRCLTKDRKELSLSLRRSEFCLPMKAFMREVIAFCWVLWATGPVNKPLIPYFVDN